MTTAYLIIKKTVGSEGKPFVDKVLATKMQALDELRRDRDHFHRIDEGDGSIISEIYSQGKIFTVNWFDYITHRKCSYTVRVKKVELGD